MRAITDRVIDAWPVGSAFPIHVETQRITQPPQRDERCRPDAQWKPGQRCQRGLEPIDPQGHAGVTGTASTQRMACAIRTRHSHRSAVPTKKRLAASPSQSPITP